MCRGVATHSRMPARCCALAGGGQRTLPLPQTQLGRSERTGAPGGLRVPGFWEVPASEQEHVRQGGQIPQRRAGPGGGGLLITRR